MRLVRQPNGSSLCGQCCVAMVANVTLKEACAAVGHEKKRGTTTPEIVAALRKLGVHCADRLKRTAKHRTIPRRAIIATYSKRGSGHWMLAWDGEVFDPEGCYPNYEGWGITSYLEIYE
jgi:hypothetical protein